MDSPNSGDRRPAPMGGTDEFAAIDLLRSRFESAARSVHPEGELPPPGETWIGDDAAVLGPGLVRSGRLGYRPGRRGRPCRSRPVRPRRRRLQGADGHRVRSGRHGGLAPLRPGLDRRPRGDRPRPAGGRGGRCGHRFGLRGGGRRPLGVSGPGGLDVGGGHPAGRTGSAALAPFGGPAGPSPVRDRTPGRVGRRPPPPACR